MALESSSSSRLLFGTKGEADNIMELMTNSQHESPQQDLNIFAPKKKRNQPQALYPNANVIAVSPNTLLDSNRFLCEICYKGFSRKQNLTLHRRAHNLPFTLKTRTPKEPVARKVYLCPEPTCIHHNRSHALGDFGGLKKHYLRKHCTEKKYKCETCYKAYSVESDLRAHSKICTRKKYMCHCGCGFSRGYHLLVGANKDPQTLDMGECSTKNTKHNNNISIDPPNSSNIQNQPNSYKSQLRQFGVDHSGLMIYPSMGLNLIETPFASPTSTHHNQQQRREDSNIELYADLLTNKIPLQNVNLDMSLMGNYGNVYGPREGSNSSLDGGFVLDPSNSLNLTQFMYTTSLNETVNTSIGGRMEVLSYETSPTTGESLALSQQNPINKQHGFWF